MVYFWIWYYTPLVSMNVSKPDIVNDTANCKLVIVI